MAFDRHRLWREVAHIYEHLEQHPREGFQPVVEAFTAASERPIVVAVAKTRRDPDDPWIKLFMGDDDGGYVFVHEAHLERVEVTYKSTEVASPVASAATAARYPTGFRAEIDDEDGGGGD